jgi:large subunit ribosomal protein L20
MPRAKGGFKTRRRHKRVLALAKGYWGTKSKLFRAATEAVDRALKFAYRDRRVRKREMRSLWIVRINAAARLNDLSYNQFMGGLRKANITLDRKVLAEMALNEPQGFAHLAGIAKDSLAAH